MILVDNRDTVIMLGGSKLQVPAIKAAQDFGFRVVCADFNPNAIGFEIADGFSLTSTLDVDAVEKLAKDEKASFVITSTSDAPVETAALVSEKLGLPTGISAANAICATQKDEMRLRLEGNNIPMPDFRICRTVEDFTSALEYFDYDCIAKPSDAAASRGVKLITPDDYSEDVDKLFGFFRAFSRKGVVMVEERMSGPEVSVEAITVNGETSILSITDKLTTEPPYFVELGHSEPSRLSASAQQAIREIARKTITAIGIVSGPSHTEVMLTNDGPKVIETAARLGGDFITSRLVPLSTGVDVVKGSVSLALGLPYDFSIKMHRGSAIRFITTSSPGVLQSINFHDDVENNPYVKEVDLYLSAGDHIDTPHSSNDRVGHVVCVGEDAEAAAETAKAMIDKIEIGIA